MLGENFTEEYRYPIKIYRIRQLEFANGLEIRKVIFALFLGTLIILSFLMIGLKSDTNLVRFFLKNWLIILVVVPSTVTFVVFNLKYDNKNIIPFLRDRVHFYRTRNKSYEHFSEVPRGQVQSELTFEPFVKEVTEE
jgi:glucan phosphoethanolaminetransferase (alkaline phosphatase superfamily)